MSSGRLIAPDTRAGILVTLGTALFAAPFAIGLSGAAIAAGVAIGVLVIGLGLAGTAFNGRGTLPVGAHQTYDRGLALGLVASAVAFLAAGEPAAAALFGFAGLFQGIVGSLTRYTTPPNFR